MSTTHLSEIRSSRARPGQAARKAFREASTRENVVGAGLALSERDVAELDRIGTVSARA